MTAILVAIGAARSGQYGVWRGEIVAQARVDAANEHPDDTVDETGKALERAVDCDHEEPRRVRYVGTSTIKKIKAQGLEVEVKTARAWPKSLATEPEKALRKQELRLPDALTRGDDALRARNASASVRRDFMARDKAKLVDALNDLRLDLHADPTKRVVANRLDRAWPDRFFRRGTSKPAAETPDAPPQPCLRRPARDHDGA